MKTMFNYTMISEVSNFVDVTSQLSNKCQNMIDTGYILSVYEARYIDKHLQNWPFYIVE